jgi:OOP family OmpA-OmpF porin
MKAALLIVAAIVGLPATALAASPSIIDENEAGFFVGAGLGQTKLRVTSPELEGSGEADETGFKLLAGYQFNRFFSLEGSYYQPGKVSESEDGDSITLETDVLQGFAVGTLPIIEGRLDVFGKVGLSYWDSKLTASSGFQTGSVSDDGTDLTWGIGVGARITDRLTSSIEFEQTEIDAPIGDLPLTWRLRFFYAALKYRF